MGESNRTPTRIHQKNRATIGRVNSKAHTFAVRYQAVDRWKKAGAVFFNHCDTRPVDLLGDTEGVLAKAEFSPQGGVRGSQTLHRLRTLCVDGYAGLADGKRVNDALSGPLGAGFRQHLCRGSRPGLFPLPAKAAHGLKRSAGLGGLPLWSTFFSRAANGSLNDSV